MKEWVFIVLAICKQVKRGTGRYWLNKLYESMLGMTKAIMEGQWGCKKY